MAAAQPDEAARMRHGAGVPSRLLRVLVPGIVAAAVAVLTPLAASARSSDEATAAALVNASRASAGLRTLPRDGVLDTLAARHNARMASNGRIFHNGALPSQLSATGARWVVVGENVGVGPAVGDVHDAFMLSRTHRDNVLSSEHNAVGIAVTTAGGRVYVTQVFALLGPPAARTAPAERSCSLRTAEDGTRVPASFYGLPC